MADIADTVEETQWKGKVYDLPVIGDKLRFGSMIATYQNKRISYVEWLDDNKSILHYWPTEDNEDPIETVLIDAEVIVKWNKDYKPIVYNPPAVIDIESVLKRLNELEDFVLELAHYGLIEPIPLYFDTDRQYQRAAVTWTIALKARTLHEKKMNVYIAKEENETYNTE